MAELPVDFRITARLYSLRWDSVKWGTLDDGDALDDSGPLRVSVGLTMRGTREDVLHIEHPLEVQVSLT